jgi:hypothetical protein
MNKRDEEYLYLAVGFVVTTWGRIEGLSSMVTNAMYLNASCSKMPKSMPKFIRDQHRFMRRMLIESAEFDAMRSEGIALLDKTAHLKGFRENFVHSFLTGFDESRGAYKYTRLDSAVDGHLAKDWEFDARSFPRLHDELSTLSIEWHKFAVRVVTHSDSPQSGD